MKITALKTFIAPTTGNFFVKVETDEGIYGLGEAGLKRRGTAIAEVIRSFSPDVIGQDPFRIEHLWQVMFRGGFFPGGVVQSSAVSAVDIALWDIKGKALGVPVYELLGGRTRDKVACYPHVGDKYNIDRLVENCKQRQEEGWKFVRWGLSDPTDPNVFEPSRAVRHGIKQVKAVREACGDEIEICVDVHTRLDPAWVIAYCKGVEPYRPFFIEAPLPADNLAGYARLADAVDTRIAVGDWGFTTRFEFEDIMEKGRVDVVQPSSVRSGGIREIARIAEAAYRRGLICVPHAWCHVVGVAAEIHLAAVLPNMPYFETPIAFPDSPIISELLTPTMEVDADGFIQVPDRPGLGFALNEDVVKHFRVDPH